MMYSTTIPVLYIAGCLLCIVQYWVDKALFVKHYKIPPRYGLGLARYCRETIEWALLVHLFMGLYTMSNPEVFPVLDKTNKTVDVL